MKLLIRNLSFTLFVAIIFSITSCLKSRVDGGETPKTDNIFNFATSTSNILKVKFDVPKGYNVYFEVYTKSPLFEDGSKNPEVTTIDKGYTDENGLYENPIKVPAYVKEVYIYSPDAGVPRLIRAEVKNGVITTAFVPVAASAMSMTRAVIQDELGGTFGKKINNGNNIVSFGEWCNYNIQKKGDDGNYYPLDAKFSDGGIPRAKLLGRMVQMQYVEHDLFAGDFGEPETDQGKDAMVITKSLLDKINAVLPGGDNSVDAEYTEKDADIKILKETVLDLFLIDENAEDFNTLTYYCYETANPPKNTNDIKFQTIAFPNVKLIKARSEEIVKKSGIKEYGALVKGEGVRLHYYKDGADMGVTFPAGVSVGLVLHCGTYDYESGSIVNGKQELYSSLALKNGKSHMASFKADDYNIISIEETFNTGKSSDYKDIILAFKGNDSGSISNGGEEEPTPPVEEDKEFMNHYYGVLAFEDMWPHQGDFDMNDVIVRYKSDITMNKQNEVTKTVNNFTIVWSGARMNNTFAYEDVNISEGAGSGTITGGDSNSNRQGNVIYLAKNILGYANNTEKTTFTVETTYSSPIPKAKFKLPPYNPFITANGDASKEIHLTNNIPTKAADMSLFGTSKDKSSIENNIFYVTFINELQMPFAIEMMFENEEQAKVFMLMEETKRIDETYPRFINWLTSGGQKDQDWYIK